MFDDVSLIFVGYDGYVDVWNHCFNLLNEYWKERPKTYLASSVIRPEYKNVEVVAAGEDTEWSLRAKAVLDKVTTPYVILMLEDFFVSDYVDNEMIRDIIELIKENEIKFYQLNVQLIKQSWEKGKVFKGNRRIKIVPKDKKYGVNLQAAVWETEFLKKMIGNENYNAWKFEMNQLDVSSYNENRIEYLIDTRNPLNIIHTIVQSKYLRGALRKLRKKGYYIDSSEREVLSKKENFKYVFKLLMYSITPKWLVKPFKGIGRLLKIDFVTDRIK